MSQCMICQRRYEPLVVFQLCCSSGCAEQAGRSEKERDEVRKLLDQRLQEAFNGGKSVDGMDIRSNVGINDSAAADLSRQD